MKILQLFPLLCLFGSAHCDAARFVSTDLRVMTGYNVGLRFDRLKQEGPGQVIFIDNALATGATTAQGVYNRFNMVFMEYAAYVEALCYKTYSFKLAGSYGSHVGPMTYRTNEDWTGRGLVQRFSTKPYAYDFDIRAQRWFLMDSTSSFAFVAGWGFHMLNLGSDSRTRFDAPFLGFDSRSVFSEVFTLDTEFSYAFVGGRREYIRYVRDRNQSADSPLFFMKNGHVAGPRFRLCLGFAFSEHWHFEATYRYQNLRTNQREMDIDGISVSNQVSQGTWDEKTALRSHGIYIGLGGSF